ncbi:MAG: alpha/beta hydrolase [Chloroflexota bacterium]
MSVAYINGVKLNYEVAGQGEAIVFLHGMMGSTESWTNQFAALSSNYRVIALDNRGHGKSSSPATEDEYSIEIFANDVCGLLKWLNIKKCCLGGHSFGGYVALQFAVEQPDMLAALVLVDTAGEQIARPPDYAQLRQKLEELARSQGIDAALEYEAANNPVRIVRQRKPAISVDGYIYVPRAFGKWQGVTSQLSEIKVPTIIFRGEEDLRFVEAVQTLNNGIAGSELITVKGAGHTPHEEAPDVFNRELLRFLDRVKW